MTTACGRPLGAAGCQHTVRYGRIGTKGQSQTKAFRNPIDARRDYEQLIRGKVKKGYRER